MRNLIENMQENVIRNFYEVKIGNFVLILCDCGREEFVSVANYTRATAATATIPRISMVGCRRLSYGVGYLNGCAWIATRQNTLPIDQIKNPSENNWGFLSSKSRISHQYSYRRYQKILSTTPQKTPSYYRFLI